MPTVRNAASAARPALRSREDDAAAHVCAYVPIRARPPRRVACRSGKNVPHHLARDAGQPRVQALKLHGQTLVVDP